MTTWKQQVSASRRGWGWGSGQLPVDLPPAWFHLPVDDFLEPEEYEEPEGAELGEAADLGRSGNGPVGLGMG